MIHSSNIKTYEVAKRHLELKTNIVGGLYPDVILDDNYYQKRGACENAPELAGLQPEGFVPGSRFDDACFNMDIVREVRETALRYFERLDCFDCECDLVRVVDLVNALHSCPESMTQGKARPGEVILALWMAGIPFHKMPQADGGLVFAVDWDTICDPLNYMDKRHGFENLLRPSGCAVHAS